MLTLERVTQKQFYAALEGKQVTLIDRVYTKASAAIPVRFLDGEGLNTGKFIKRSKDFYRLLQQGKSFGNLKHTSIHKAFNSKGEVVYIVFKTGIGWDFSLLYKVSGEAQQA